MTARAIIAWHPLLTDHQSRTLAALGDAAGLPVTVAVTRTDDAVRQAQGWTFDPPPSLDVELLPVRHRARTARRRLASHGGDVHLFGSPFEDVSLMLTLAAALARRTSTFLIAEPYPTATTSYFASTGWRDRLKAALRPALYRGYGLALRRRVSGVFAISPQAVRQFRSLGIAPERVFPFGYFVPSSGVRRPLVSRRAGPLRVVFIGALIERKGLHDLANAARRLRDVGTAVEISVYGPGDPLPFDLAGAGIRYHGSAPFGTAQSIFAEHDLAVVPSRHDGWGVVVNEALLAGVPVLCSDAVGACAILRKWGCGMVYPAADADALAAALAALAVDPARLDAMAAAAARVAPLLEPAVAGRYMHDAIASAAGRGQVPACPWYDA